MNSQSSKRELFGQEMKKWWEENKNVWGTQKNFANHVGIGKSTLGDYIRGISLPSPEIAEKIYEITHLDILKPKSGPDPQMPLPEKATQGQEPTEEPSNDNGKSIQRGENPRVQKETPQGQIPAPESGSVNRQSIQYDVKPKVLEEEAMSDTDTQTAESIQTSLYSTPAERQELFIPVFGFVWLYPEEIRILDHPAVQRLGRINQLGLSYLVYRGATHRRLEHSIGTVYIAQRMINAVQHNADKALKRNQRCGVSIQQPSEERFIRLGALLHDVGHVASGHTIEDQMCLICKHDSDERLNKLFNDTKGLWIDKDGLSLGQLIDREFQKYLPKDLAEKGISPSEIVRFLIRKCPKPEEDAFLTKQKIVEESSEIRLNICRDIIGNTICADILDYLHRDWYHIGKYRTFDDRILQYMEICPEEQSISTKNPIPKNADQFVVCLGKSPKIRTDAVSQILELLEWRYQLAETVLFHRTKLAAEAMLERALFDLWGTDSEIAEEALLRIGDDEFFRVCRELVEKEKGKDSISVKLLYALEKRQFFTSLCTLSYYDLVPDRRRMIQDQYSPRAESPSVPVTNRNRILRVLENDFSLTPGSLAMFCPSGSMQAKVADVVIKVGDKVSKFSEYEEKNENLLSAGHLAAQISRFKRLWRVHFFINRAEKKRIGPMIEQLLQDAVVKLALGVLQPYEEESPEMIAKNIAKSLTAIESFPLYGHTVRDKPVAAAYSGVEAATGMYTFGAPSIRSYIENEPSKSGS